MTDQRRKYVNPSSRPWHTFSRGLCCGALMLTAAPYASAFEPGVPEAADHLDTVIEVPTESSPLLATIGHLMEVYAATSEDDPRTAALREAIGNLVTHTLTNMTGLSWDDPNVDPDGSTVTLRAIVPLTVPENVSESDLEPLQQQLRERADAVKAVVSNMVYTDPRQQIQDLQSQIAKLREEGSEISKKLEQEKDPKKKEGLEVIKGLIISQIKELEKQIAKLKEQLVRRSPTGMGGPNPGGGGGGGPIFGPIHARIDYYPPGTGTGGDHATVTATLAFVFFFSPVPSAPSVMEQ